MPQDFQQQIFSFLMGSQFWPPSEIDAYQKSQLAQLLRFAHGTVPFYKSRLAPVMRADGEINWDRWHEVPILKRQDLLDHREVMLADELPPGHGHSSDHQGSGTTGKPATTRHNMLTAITSQAAMFRAFTWYNTNFTRNFCSFSTDGNNEGALPDGTSKGPWGPSWLKESAEGKLLQLSASATAEQVVEFMIRKNVAYLNGWSNKMHSVAMAAEAMGAKHKLDAIYIHGTSASDGARADCLRVFGAEIFTNYASKEVYNIGHQCPSGHHYHVNPELLLLEVLDVTGQPCPPGVAGRAVITQFYNTAQPFIRYDIGDQIVMGEGCSCGRNLPVIERIEGRIVHNFRFPGRKPVAFSFNSIMMKKIAARGWQIAQVAPLTIEVRYIPDGSGARQDLDGFAALVRERSDPRVEVRYKVVDTLTLTPSGKLIDFVCELPPEA